MEFQKSHRATTASVAGNITTPQTLLAANMNRVGFSLHSTNANAVYVKFGPTASATDFSLTLTSGSPAFHSGQLNVPYTGIITALWVTTTDAVKVTEFLE